MSEPENPGGGRQQGGAIAKPTGSAEMVPYNVERLSKRAGELVGKSLSESTKSTYGRAIRAFNDWCLERGASSLPATDITVAEFVTEAHDRKIAVSTLYVTLAAIRARHLAHGHPSPADGELIRRVMGGAAREDAEYRVDRKKKPLTSQGPLVEVLEAIIAGIDETRGLLQEMKEAGVPTRGARAFVIDKRKLEARLLAALRDKALLLIGFAGALRRSELAAIRIGHVRKAERGILLTVPRSKTDQEGKGRTIAIPFGKRFCPVAAYDEWVVAAGLHNGPAFVRIYKDGRIGMEAIAGATVAEIVKMRAKAAGLDPKKFSGHSMRSGFLTSAGKKGANLWKMMDQAGQKSVNTTRGYVRDEELFEDNAGEDLL